MSSILRVALACAVAGCGSSPLVSGTRGSGSSSPSVPLVGSDAATAGTSDDAGRASSQQADGAANVPNVTDAGGTVNADAATAGDAMGAADANAAPPTLASTQTLIPDPSWTCGMPAGIPAPSMGVKVFDANLTLGAVHDVGQTQYGHRLVIEIHGGTVTGPKIQAQFMNFGLDWQLTLSNGAVEDEQVDVLQTTDGTPIYFRNCGTSPDTTSDARIVPDFEAPTSSAYAWLNTGKYVGTRTFDAAAKTLTLSVYDVSGVTPSTDRVRVTDPAGVPDQSWDCKTASGTKTSVVYMESVGIGAGSVSVGASKRGTRNVVPITGGTTMGKIQGSVLAGGADFQLSTSSFNLDARYTLQTGDGTLIVVRNCGPLGALVPVFETATNGSYAWANANRWLSSDPSVGAGVVNLTIYDTQ